jgi:Fe2+ or Zn2+ uptake regulation protein
MTAEAGGLVDALDRAGYRLTEPRRAVATLIAGRQGYFTAADLEEDSRARHLPIGRATIFRALDLFTELGVVERVDLPAGGHAYVPCEPVHHHHHVICTNCGRVTEIEDVGIGALLEAVKRETGYDVASHRLELFGWCPVCQAELRA